MTDEQFNELLSETQETMRNTLIQKAKEYQRGDRLSNFKTAATRLNCTPERALLGMLEKHSTAIFDYVNDLEVGRRMPLEQWQEKIIDSINYLVLLLALATERE